MSDRDRVGAGDSLEVRFAVPEGEEARMTGGVVYDPPTDDPKYAPTSPQPPAIKTDIREHAGGKGFGIFVSAQPAPLTINNMTWHPTSAAASTVVDWFHENFGWQWVPPAFKQEQVARIDPNTGLQAFYVDGVTGDTVLIFDEVDTDEVIRPGFWKHDYSVVFDSLTFAALMAEANS